MALGQPTAAARRTRAAFVALTAGVLLAAGATSALAAQATPAAAARLAPTPHLTIAFAGQRMVVRGQHSLRSGRVSFTVTADSQAGSGAFELVQLGRGYPLSTFRSQLTAAQTRHDRTALRSVVAHTTFIGGLATQTGRAATMSVTLGTGSYWIFDDAATPTNFVKLTLSGSIADRARPKTFTTIAVAQRDRWNLSRSRLPLRANISFENDSRDPQTLLLFSVKPSTTPAQLRLWARSGSLTPPAWATGVEAGTGVLSGTVNPSGAHRFVYSYDLPKGKYALVSLFPDLQSGRTHAQLGMYQFIRLG